MNNFENFQNSELISQASEISSVIFSNSSWILWKILENLPSILSWVWIILVWFLLWNLIEKIILKIFEKLRVKKIFEKINFNSFLEKAWIKSSPIKVSTDFLKWYIFLVFFLAGTNLMWLTSISEFLDSVINFLPKLVIALFIVLIWLNFANTVASLIKNTMKMTDVKWWEVVWIVAKNIIITFAILAALMQINIAEDFVKILFIWVTATLSIWLWLAIWLWWVDFVKHRLKNIEEWKVDIKNDLK